MSALSLLAAARGTPEVYPLRDRHHREPTRACMNLSLCSPFCRFIVLHLPECKRPALDQQCPAHRPFCSPRNLMTAARYFVPASSAQHTFLPFHPPLCKLNRQLLIASLIWVLYYIISAFWNAFKSLSATSNIKVCSFVHDSPASSEEVPPAFD